MSDSNDDANTSDEEDLAITEETGVIVPVKIAALFGSVQYLIDNGLITDFEKYLAATGIEDAWIDIATANALKTFLYAGKKRDPAARDIIRCGCKSWQGPKFPPKQK